MSHTVTMTRTVTTTNTSAILINTGYMKSFSGLLKLAQLILGAVCVGLVSVYYGNYFRTQDTFFLLIATTFMIGTFCLLLSCIVSLSTASIISKTIYEVVYHVIAFGLYLAASLTLLVEMNNRSKRYQEYDAYLAASIIGLVVAGLYLLSTILAIRSYRGM